jgi:hypothetical protein
MAKYGKKAQEKVKKGKCKSERRARSKVDY